MPLKNILNKLFSYNTDSRYNYELSQTQISNNIINI